ncbi:WD40 repeat domain-containing protein [Cylindrospermopsis raciborskii]|uniref:WD40 repeat domain-containing protein n=1 Tax=Cylindrospermopsis raciborskii TaxID=77022 RepID=UPI000E1F3FE6|nr:hypothetical protein [Cylindrospermopsis raciborskii]UJL34152.1 hypothetical protein C6N34_002705 [Cylindrospermopsis raciborskii Cr2010]UJS03677.1 hypothetical protein L3I90_11175 [Cylindrospermopsis raciborskii KLL07]
MNFTTNKPQKFTTHYSEKLTEYVTSLNWSKSGHKLAVTSASGEVIIWENQTITNLQTSTGKSLDCGGFSADDQYLAVGGQDGNVKIWKDKELIQTLANAPAWIDKLAWNHTNNLLAFSLGRYVQVWDVDARELVVTLNFENSSILGIDWRQDGKYLAISGYKGVKVWNRENWDEEPYILYTDTVSTGVAWSSDGKYLASANMDRSIAVLEWENPDPWLMRGFPGKIRQLAWSNRTSDTGDPILACASVEGVVMWHKSVDESVGWESTILTNHFDIVTAIAHPPQSLNYRLPNNELVLASAGADGWLCLWDENFQVWEILSGVTEGFSTLAWEPQGKFLAAGGDQGELIIWSSNNSQCEVID